MKQTCAHEQCPLTMHMLMHIAACSKCTLQHAACHVRHLDAGGNLLRMHTSPAFAYILKQLESTCRAS